jgi:hypothetical protein
LKHIGYVVGGRGSVTGAAIYNVDLSDHNFDHISEIIENLKTGKGNNDF